MLQLMLTKMRAKTDDEDEKEEGEYKKKEKDGAETSFTGVDVQETRRRHKSHLPATHRPRKAIFLTNRCIAVQCINGSGKSRYKVLLVCKQQQHSVAFYQ